MSSAGSPHRTALLVVASLGFAISPAAFSLEGFPGSSWGELSHDVDSYVGSGVMGYVNQGIDWVTLPGNVTLNTYVELRYRSRSRNNDFYDAWGPKVGLEFRRSGLALGVDYYWERFPKADPPDDRSDKVQYYLHWYYDWDLKPHVGRLASMRAAAFTGSTWGELSHDNDALVGNGAMFYVNQGVDWVKFGRDITFNTYVELRYRSRSENNDGYDSYGPKLGLELRKSGFALGANYYWERFPKLPAPDDKDNKVQLYLRWYLDWNLRRSQS